MLDNHLGNKYYLHPKLIFIHSNPLNDHLKHQIHLE